MKYRRLGRTNLSVSELALGTVELGMNYGIGDKSQTIRPTEKTAIRLIHAALDAGINLIDTARSYGESERVVGKALQHRRDRAVLATKSSALDENGESLSGHHLLRHLQTELETSLKTLATDYVDVWQIHNVDSSVLAQSEVIAHAFAHAKESGKVRWTGGSFYGADLPQHALDTDCFDTMQVAFSVVDQRIADGFLPHSHLRDIGVLARSVLLKGVLTARADYLPDRLEPLRSRSRRFRDLASDLGYGDHPARVAIAFALQTPHIHSVILGVSNHAELEEGLRAVDLMLPSELLQSLSELSLDDSALLDPGTWGI